MVEEIPKIIQDVGFDFHWDEKKVWALDVPVKLMDIKQLRWHFAFPFLWENGVYNLAPREVLDNPEAHKKEFERAMNAHFEHPIDIMINKGHWTILDGLHRLMQASILKIDKVSVRKIPRDRIPEIVNDMVG